MPRYVFVNLSNMAEYVTGTLTDPGIPAGSFLTGGSDGAVDRQTWPDGTNTGIQQFVAGVNSGGFPAYTEDTVQAAAQPNFPNGILQGAGGPPYR